MNELTVINRNRQFDIDSREVAKMVEKRHDNLVRDIDGYAEILETSILRDGLTVRVSDFFILSEYEAGNPPRKYRGYRVTRKGCEMIANKLTGEKGVLFTATYVTRFEEMEEALEQPFRIPQTYAEALRELADTWEQKETVQRELEEAKPKVAQYEVLLSTKNSRTMGEVAKCYGWGRNRLFAFLREKEVLRYNNEPYQEHIDAGRFEVRLVPFVMGGEVVNKPQTLVTAKGIDYIGKLIKNEEAKGA